jgi:hypothetical protein
MTVGFGFGYHPFGFKSNLILSYNNISPLGLYFSIFDVISGRVPGYKFVSRYLAWRLALVLNITPSGFKSNVLLRYNNISPLGLYFWIFDVISGEEMNRRARDFAKNSNSCLGALP